jgi:hypothetical protein
MDGMRERREGGAVTVDRRILVMNVEAWAGDLG